MIRANMLTKKQIKKENSSRFLKIFMLNVINCSNVKVSK